MLVEPGFGEQRIALDGNGRVLTADGSSDGFQIVRYLPIFPPARRRAVAALGLKPGDTVLEIGAGRVVVMDMGLAQGGLYRLLAPIGRLLVKYAPGDAYSDPWSDLANCGTVETQRFLLGFFYVSAVTKR